MQMWMQPAVDRVPTPPGKPWISSCKISRPWKVLEILLKGPGKSWNFLGYDVGGEHNGRVLKYAQSASKCYCAVLL